MIAWRAAVAGAALATGATTVGLAAPNHIASAADDLTIISATVTDGTATIECTVPAGMADSIDLATAVTVQENGSAVAGATVARMPSGGLEIVLLFDTSGSMREGDAIAAARRAAAAFLEALPRDVAVGIVAFNDSVSLVSPLGVDRAATRAAIATLSARGETALYDAMVFAPQLFSGATSDRQIVLLSDGGDTVSHNTPAAALAVADGIRTNVIELTSSEANAAALEQLAAADGGLLASVADPAALDGLYRDVADDLLNRFRVVFPATASGSVVYTVRVDTGRTTIAASTTVEVAATTVTTGAAATVTTGGAATTGTDATHGGGSSVSGHASGGGLSAGALATLGASAVFAAITILLLVLTAQRGAATAQELQPERRRLGRDDAATKGVGARAATLAERALTRSGIQALTQALDIAGIPLRAGEFVVVPTVAGAAGTLLLATLLPTWLGILVGVGATPLVARAVVRSRMDRRRRQFVEQLPDLLQTLVSSLRAGYGLPQSLDVAANQSSEPTRGELQRVLFEVRIGRDPGDALSAAATRMASADFTWVVSAMQINREVGGELAVVLENIAETVRERQRLRRQIRVLTAEGRVSAYILTALPFVLVLALLLTNRDYFEPFRRSPGPFLIALAVALLTAGWVWIRRLVKAEE
jgi:tight adherence protein B